MNNNDKKAQFHEALAFLIESAHINNGKVTTEEIRSSFEDIIEDESMYQLIYDYLLENKITIQGYINPSVVSTSSDTSLDVEDETVNVSDIHISTDLEDGREKNFIEMYYHDLENIDHITLEHELSLLQALINTEHSDDNAVNTLIEANLNLVLNLVREYQNKGVSIGDLIQEGNLGLIEGIMTYEKEVNLDMFHNHLELYIKNALNDVILEQNASSRISTHAADRANELDRASVALSKELERTPTLEELAKYLSLPEDEVERIMKMSLNALTIDNTVEENE